MGAPKFQAQPDTTVKTLQEDWVTKKCSLYGRNDPEVQEGHSLTKWLEQAQIFGSSCIAWEEQGRIWFPKLLRIDNFRRIDVSAVLGRISCLKLVVLFPNSQLRLSLDMKTGTSSDFSSVIYTLYTSLCLKCHAFISFWSFKDFRFSHPAKFWVPAATAAQWYFQREVNDGPTQSLITHS